MTLVLTALTPKHIVQASDRRVVWRDPGGKVLRKLDSYVKAVITPAFACSYTGSAELGAGDTAEWLAITLSDHIQDLDGGIRSLAAAAEQAVDAPLFQNEGLTIVCAGWVQRGNSTVARLTVISKPPPGQPRAFTIESINIAQRRMSCVFPAGQMLSKDELASVNREIEKLCGSGRDTARAIAQVLTETIRKVARSADRGAFVSEEVLITSLPRIDLLRASLVVGALVEEYWSVTCIPAGEPRREQHGGPIVVGHKAVIQALPPRDAPDVAGVFAGAKVIRVPEQGAGIAVIILTDPPLGQAWGWPGTALFPAGTGAAP